MNSKFGLAFLLGALLLSPGLALAGDDRNAGHEGHSLEQLVVESLVRVDITLAKVSEGPPVGRPVLEEGLDRIRKGLEAL